MIKKRKVSASDRFWRSLTRWDMFGEKVNFNLDGKETYDTCCGCFCTLLILAITAGFVLFQVRLYQSQWSELPILVKYNKEGYYEEPVEIRQVENNFYFAVAITGKQNFQGHTTQAFEESGGSIELNYIISGGEEDGKFHTFEMVPCSDLDFYVPSGIATIDAVVDAHVQVKQFFCPSAIDMSFYGENEDANKKILFMDVKAKSDSALDYLEGKHLAMLVNTRKVEFSDDYEEVSLKEYTKMIWMPINSQTPMSNVVTFTNHEFWEKETEYDQYKLSLDDVGQFSWISVDDKVVSTPFAFPRTNPSIKSQVIFQASHDLESIVHRSDRMFFINIIGLSGGVFFALQFVIALYFKMWVSWMMHLTIVRNLFKIDPAQDKKPKSQAAMKKKDPKVLLAEARTVAKKRVSMTQSYCDRIILVFDAVVGQLTCKATKFARILQQGKKEVSDDLNIYNYMSQMRMLTGTINALTTFNQRRLLMHQVETSFLLKPYSEQHDEEEDKDKKRLAQARREKSSRKKARILDDTSSEEDFFFLEKALNETNELDEVDQRLLMGIIQAPPKEKKRWDKEDPEEARRRRKEKAIARGEPFSDSYDDETEGNERDDEMTKMGGLEDGDASGSALVVQKDGKTMMHNVLKARNHAMGRAVGGNVSEVPLPCPEGYDPVKWAQMTRQQKMKVLGISEKEWDKMSREQQMKRMNNLAHGFHFYSMNKK